MGGKHFHNHFLNGMFAFLRLSPGDRRENHVEKEEEEEEKTPESNVRVSPTTSLSTAGEYSLPVLGKVCGCEGEKYQRGCTPPQPDQTHTYTHTHNTHTHTAQNSTFSVEKSPPSYHCVVQQNSERNTDRPP